MHPDTATAVVQVEPVTAATATAVRRLQVLPGQRAFVGDASATLDEALRDASSEAMAIVRCAGHPGGDGGADPTPRVVGFYRLDFAPIVIDGQSLGEDAVSLRSLMIDQHWQGRGVATRALAACCTDLRARHPGRRRLALAVHAANTVALALYRRAGFVDTGCVLADTPTGLQRILLRRLDATLPAAAGHAEGVGQFRP